MEKVVKPGTSSVRYLEIDTHRAGQRLDNFLITTLKGVPRSHIYRILRTGEVRINRGKVGPDYRLKAGDSVRIPPLRTAQASETDPQQTAKSFGWLQSRILHEDDELLIVNKPAGLAVHGGSGVSVGLIEALRSLRPDAPVLELAHRLDRDTSGCLLLAKNRPALLALHRMLREGDMAKSYLALVAGSWRGGEREVSFALEKNRLRSGERIVEIHETGKAATSIFTPYQRYGFATLMEVTLLTGRTHQARVHAAHLAHPIAGDDKYGDREFNSRMKALGLKRLFLHAQRLRFMHPQTGYTMNIEAPLPTELVTILEKLTS